MTNDIAYRPLHFCDSGLFPLGNYVECCQFFECELFKLLNVSKSGHFPEPPRNSNLILMAVFDILYYKGIIITIFNIIDVLSAI
jgi:hypothetical protein